AWRAGLSSTVRQVHCRGPENERRGATGVMTVGAIMRRVSFLLFCFSAFLHFLTGLFYGRSCFFHSSTRLFFGLIHCFIYGLAGLVDFRLAAERERRESNQGC